MIKGKTVTRTEKQGILSNFCFINILDCAGIQEDVTLDSQFHVEASDSDSFDDLYYGQKWIFTGPGNAEEMDEESKTGYIEIIRDSKFLSLNPIFF